VFWLVAAWNVIVFSATTAYVASVASGRSCRMIVLNRVQAVSSGEAVSMGRLQDRDVFGI
jgi:hypothetical protein